MTEKHDDIAELLRKTPAISPDEKAKNEAISMAMGVFDKKYASRCQGISLMTRLTYTAQSVFETFRGESFMKTSYAIAGTLCLGAVGFTLMNTSSLFDLGARRGVQEEVTTSIIAPQVIAPQAAPAPAPALKQESLERKKSSVEGLSDGAAQNYAKADARVMLDLNSQLAGASAPQAMMAAPPTTTLMIREGESDASIAVLPENHDKFKNKDSNSLKLTKQEPVSTFSVDVDTASYSYVRSSLNNNVMPDKDAVRVEELVNYFPYSYEVPSSKSEPFKASTAVFDSPWNKGTKILHVGIKGFEIAQKQKPHSNLVFLLDTSGSMYEGNKLPLVQKSLKLLLETMNPDDTIAIVTYAGSAGVALEPTAAKDKAKIIAVLDNLAAGGSTAGAEGIREAYQLAEQHFDKEGVNRVILATDGDFNVGITDPEELKRFVEKKRETGIFLSVLGFGRGNYNDAMMQVLAQNGNGNASYIDNLSEARKVLVDEAASTLFPIAKDVKIQVEFNPATVSEYRLIGYETRILNREDFNNDKVDAGDIGAGHTVTALYEITPKGSNSELVDDLRYQDRESSETKADSGEYAFVKIRYKLPEGKVSKLLTYPVKVSDALGDISKAPEDTRFATSVAAFGQLLRGESYVGSFNFDDVISMANASKGTDEYGYRAEFINLVRLAKTLNTVSSPSTGSSTLN